MFIFTQWKLFSHRMLFLNHVDANLRNTPLGINLKHLEALFPAVISASESILMCRLRPRDEKSDWKSKFITIAD